jgi:NitT/TauT family transport system substrate-binding protein
LGRILLATLASSSIAVVTACPALADAPIHLEVGTMPGDASAEVFYAQERGFFKDEGLDVHITVFTNVSAQAAAVSGGSIVVGNGGVGSIAVAREHGILERVIAPASVYRPAALTARLMVGNHSTIRSAADLNGKTIATNGLQDQAQLESELWLEKHGADLRSIHFVEVPFPQMAGALERGQVAAALMVEPLITAAGDRVRMLGDAMGAIAPDFVSTGWFASDAWVQANPDVAARFVRAILRTARWANGHHAETAQILVRSAKLDPEIASKMTRSTYGTTLTPELLQPVLDMFAHFGTLPKPMPAGEVIWAGSPAVARR